MDHCIIVPLASRTNPGHVALIDEADVELVAPYHWILRTRTNTNHAYAWLKGHRRLHLHRLILDAPNDKEVDHINGYGLDCRHSNMRLATRTENARNRHAKPRKGVTHTQYRGIYRRPSRTGYRWLARIRLDGKYITLGTFATDREAADAYDHAAREHHGVFARVNFPD